MAEKERKWEMNDTQKEFVKILKENPDGLTLREIKKNYGKEFKSGSINTLVSKGYVNKTYNDTVYKLVVAEE